MYPKRRAIKRVIAFIIIVVVGHGIGHLALVHQSKIWNKGLSTLKPLTVIPGTFLVHNTTVVTAFIDIGPVKKSKHTIRSQATYFEWAKAFQYMRNALVVYTDSEPFRNHITAVRSNLSAITEIFMVNRSLLWSFQNLPKITKIYNSKYHPKDHLDISPLYACVTHAKFDLLLNATQDNIFKTTYFMWLDIGYFKYRKSRDMFHLSQPKHFNDLKIAMTQIKDLDKSMSPKTILITSRRYVAGGLIYGDRARVMLFVEDFKRAVRYFLSKKLINCEEPILYAMFTAKGKQILGPTVELQVYREGNKIRNWRYLGNSMITEENITRF